MQPWSRREFVAGLSGFGLSGVATGASGAPDESGPPEGSLDLLRDASGPKWSAIREQFLLVPCHR